MYKSLKLGSKIIASNFKTLKEPYKLTFAITYKCNSKCKTCEIWKKTIQDELTLEEISNIFEKINPSWVNLTGGEPFLRDDLFEIAKIIRKKDVYLLNLTTNGVLVDKIKDEVEKILRLGFPRFIVSVSLDGSKEIHDKIRGVKGNWEKAVVLYKNLKKLCDTNSNFQTFFGYTISKYNVGLIEEALEEVKKKVDVTINDFHFNVYHTSSFYYGNRAEDKQKDLKSKILNDVDYILKEKKGFGSISFLEKKYVKLIKKYFETGVSPLSCKAMTSSCFIEPDGNVYPCIGFDEKLANLRDLNYDLKKIWNLEKAKKTRRQIKENKCGGCWTPCEAYQTILGNLFRI